MSQPQTPTAEAPAVSPLNGARVVTVKAAAERGPLDYSALKWQLFYRKKTGLDKAVLKIGPRVYIDLDAYDRWLESLREAG